MSHKNHRLNIIFICGLLTMVYGLAGCDAFVRKFTRKPKKENLPQEEMVLAPVEYKAPALSKQEEYRQYFLYWKSWHDELIESLAGNPNRKKRLECIAQAIKNLEQLKTMLKEESRKKLADYIKQLSVLKDAIEKDIYGDDASLTRMTAERIKRNILRDFSYDKIK